MSDWITSNFCYGTFISCEILLEIRHCETSVLSRWHRLNLVYTRAFRKGKNALEYCRKLLKSSNQILRYIRKRIRLTNNNNSTAHCFAYLIYEPRHEKTCLCHMRTTKAQISMRIRAAFVLRCLDSLVFISEISSLYLASVAAQAGLSLPWSQTPKTGFLVTRLIYICWPECHESQGGRAHRRASVILNAPLSFALSTFS